MMTFNKLKNTGSLWLPQVPEHWELVKVRHLFKESTQKGFPNEPLLVASQELGVVSKESYGKRSMEATKDFQNLKLVEKGNFVISLRSFQGGIELAHQRGIISPAYTILKETRKIDKRYFKFLFKSLPFISLMTLCVKGIRDGQNIDYPTFKGEFLPLPPFEEQNRIGAYLDKKNNEIEKFIRNKEKLIKLFESNKNAIIKKSLEAGVSEIKFKYLLKIQNGDGFSSELVRDEGEFEVYGGNGVLGYYNKFNVNEETLIIGRVGALCGNVHYTNKRVWVNDNAMFVKTRHNFRYLFYLLQNANLNSLSFANAQPLITGTLVKNRLTKYHSNINDQKEVVLKIEDKLDELNLIIIKAQNEISAIKEYREALITDLVTGKRQVPAAFSLIHPGNEVHLGHEPVDAYSVNLEDN